VTLVANGGSNGSEGGVISFDQVGAATLIANGGSNGGGGGSIGVGRAPGARAEVFGNGNLTCKPGATIGSLEGDGFVFLGGLLTVGTTNLSTEFSGSIQNSGSLTKSGTGTFTLTGTNTYTEGTTVLSGILSVNNPTGSGTGTGPVQVNAGTLGGTGTIAGAVTIGTGSGAGAFLETSAGVVKPSSLSIQGALIFKADSTYTYNLNTKRAKADKVIANGVTIENGAQFSFVASGKKTLTPGKKFIVISNTAATALAGTFTNLPDGGTITVGSNTFQISYEGGGGNDLTLTVVP
jgi:autotransporter-associated beta strand protein